MKWDKDEWDKERDRDMRGRWGKGRFKNQRWMRGGCTPKWESVMNRGWYMLRFLKEDMGLRRRWTKYDHSLVHTFVGSLIHSFIHSFIYLFIHGWWYLLGFLKGGWEECDWGGDGQDSIIVDIKETKAWIFWCLDEDSGSAKARPEWGRMNEWMNEWMNEGRKESMNDWMRRRT